MSGNKDSENRLLRKVGHKSRISIDSGIAMSMEGVFRAKSISFHTEANFQEMVEEADVFVDKSMLIAAIIKQLRRSLLFKKPRRFGKSTNMHMLRTFFQNREYMKEGPSKKDVLQLFTGGRKKINSQKQQWVTQPLAIAKDEDWGAVYSQHLCSYPVIYMSWKDIKRDTHQEVVRRMQEQMKNLFKYHLYLKEKLEKGKNQSSLLQFNRLLYGQCNQTQLQKSLKFLSELLKDHYNKKVIILIDEYDAPFSHLLLQELSETDPSKRAALRREREQVQQFLGNMLSTALKNNDYLYKGVLTGIFDYILDLNTMKFIGIADEEYSQFYGFSKEQIQEQLLDRMLMVGKVGVADKRELLSARIREWYQGYAVYSDNGTRKHLLYNPFDVINYLMDCVSNKYIVQGKSYWIESASDQFLTTIFRVAGENINKIMSLSPTSTTELWYYPSRSFACISDASKIREQQLASLLLDSGYITGRVSEKNNNIRAVIPNREIQKKFTSLLIDWAKQCQILSFIEKTSIPIYNTVQYLKKMVSSIREARKVIYFSDQRVCKSFFAMVYARSKDPSHKVQTGMYQIGIGNLFVPKHCDRFGTVFINEYKLQRDSTQKEVRYFEALLQIYRRNYFKLAVQSHRVKEFTIRPIVIVEDYKFQEIYLFMDDESDITYTIEQAQILSRNSDFLKKVAAERELNSDNFNLRRQKERFLKQIRQFISERGQSKEGKELSRSLEKMTIVGQATKISLLSEYFDHAKAHECLRLKFFNDRKKKVKATRYPLRSNFSTFLQQSQVEFGSDYQIFAEIFSNSESLYNCSKRDLRLLMGNDKSEAVFEALQEMKRNRQFYKGLPASYCLRGTQQGEREESSEHHSPKKEQRSKSKKGKSVPKNAKKKEQ